MFTKAIRKLVIFLKNDFFYDAKCRLSFPNKGDYRKIDLLNVYMAKGIQRGEIRHIRNGIAQGKAELYGRNEQFILELLDFGKTEHEVGGQTAY